MSKLKKILVFDNEFEARLMEAILDERNVPHVIKPYHDSAYDGIFQVQKGWGHLEVPEESESEVLAIYADLSK